MKKTGKKVAFLGCFAALSLVLSYVETVIPPLWSAVPGIKLGLPNVVIVFLLYRFGVKEAALVSFVRIVVSALLFGSPVTFIYSAAGAFLSLAAMALSRRSDLLSELGTSALGGVLHNAGQILVALLMLKTTELGYYFIVLSITGTVSGILIGLCGGILLRKVPTMKF